MAYNNYYPGSYQPYYQQPMQQAPKQMDNRIWVQGEVGAKSYLVAPNSKVDLWDTESYTIYVKSADANGIPSIVTIDYTYRDMPKNQPANQTSGYATSDELAEVKKHIEDIKKYFDNKLDELAGGTDE